MACVVALPFSDLAPCTPAVLRLILPDTPVPLSYVSSTGSGVSPSSLLQYGIVQRKVSHQPLQPAIFFLQFFQSPGLFHPHAAIPSAPAVIGLFGYPDLSAGFTDSSSLADQNFSFAQLVDDLLRFECSFGQ